MKLNMINWSTTNSKVEKEEKNTRGIEWRIVVDAGCSGEWHFHYDGP